MVNGNPAIVYTVPGAGQVRYIRANDADGTSWPGLGVACWGSPGSGEIGRYSISVVNGRPAIAYDHGKGLLLFVRANDTNGSSWPTPTSVHTGVAGSVSLAVIGGAPAISCSSPQARYVRARDADGVSWNNPLDLGGGYSATGTALIDLNGSPAIAYGELSGIDALKFSTKSAPAPFTINWIAIEPKQANIVKRLRNLC